MSRKRSAPQTTTVVQAVWLPGPTEVEVVGETFYAAAIREAERSVQPSGELTALLVPEPDNPHDPWAVAVYLEGRKAGHLPASVARKVQPALLAFVAARGGKHAACPGIVRWHDVGPQVTVLLDTDPLGLSPHVFDHIPDLDQVLMRTLRILDLLRPLANGCDLAAREKLVAAEALRLAIDADWECKPDTWPHAEHAFRDVARELESAGDPLVSDAWTGVAQSVRYQKGRRNDWISAAVAALYWNRSNERAWAELVDLAAAAPHIPTMLELFRRVPVDSRPSVLSALIRISRGHDRLGNMWPDAGERLRAQLLAFVQNDGDTVSTAKLIRDMKRHPPLNNDHRNRDYMAGQPFISISKDN